MNWREEKMKIKIIDLLNKVANGEEVPKKIKGRLNKIYTYSKYNTDYQDKEGKLLFYKLFQFRDKCLNDEVEIVEEDIKENPTFEEYKENPEKYWNKLCKDLDEIKQLLEKF